MGSKNKHQNKSVRCTKNKNQNNQSHIPVLLTEVLEYLAPEQGDAYLDLTAGYGGHADAILERTGSPDRMTLVDRDPRAIDVLQQHYASKGRGKSGQVRFFVGPASNLSERAGSMIVFWPTLAYRHRTLTRFAGAFLFS